MTSEDAHFLSIGRRKPEIMNNDQGVYVVSST